MKHICFNNRNIIAILSYQLDSLLACSILLFNKATKLFNKATNSHQSETVGNKCVESPIAFKSKKKKKKESLSLSFVSFLSNATAPHRMQSTDWPCQGRLAPRRLPLGLHSFIMK